MIFWLYLSLLVVVNAANYKFNYINSEWVQTAGGKGQYASIGQEPVVIQFCIPADTTLGISDPVEFDDFGITTTNYTVYTYTFPISTGPDIKILVDGTEEITLFRQTSPPSTTAISVVCPNDAGYLYAVRRQKRGFHRIRGRGRRLLSVNNGVDIKIKTNIWGEPSIHPNKKYLEVDGDNEVRIDLTDVHDSYPHNLLDPKGEVHKELTPGEIHILTPPISSGNYTIESPNVWTGYIKPVIRVTRRLKQFPAPTHKLRSGESAATVCPSTAGQYSITFTNGWGGVTSACDDHPNPDGSSAQQTSTQCAFSGSNAPVFQPTTNNLECGTDYTVKASCWYNWKVIELYTVYEANEEACGTYNGDCNSYHSCCYGSSFWHKTSSSASCSSQGLCDCGGWDVCSCGFACGEPCYSAKYYGSHSDCGCSSYTQVASSCYVWKSRWVDAPTVESLTYYTVTTTGCPANCVGAWATWSNCGSDNKKSRTYTQTTVAANGGTDCAHADGHGEEVTCITQGPDFGSTQADGGVASNGRKTASITFSVSTTHAESVTCAALANGASGTVSAISGASHKVTFNTAATTETSQTIGGLSDETDYDIYCAVQNAVSGPMDRTTPDLFSIIKSATTSNVKSTTATCTAAWSDASEARCVALSPGSSCSWSAIETLTGNGAPQALQTSDMTDKAFSFTGLTPATSYDCCCSSQSGSVDRPSTANFKTQGFTEDMTIDSKTQTSITFTFKTLNYNIVYCHIYTAESQWSTKTSTSGIIKVPQSGRTSDTVQKTFSSLKHYTEYHIECQQDDQTTTNSAITNAPTWTAQPSAHSHTITGFVVKTTTDRSEIAVCSAYDQGTTAPNEDAIIAGTGAVSTSGEINVAAATEKSIQISGLTFATTYDVYCAFKGDADTYGGHHTKSHKLQTTTVQPVITSQPSSSEITYHDFKVSTTYDHPKAAICIVLAAGSTAPTAGDIANTANILAQFTGDAAAATAHVDTLELGCCGTTYDVYCGQDYFNVLSNKLTVNTIQPTVSALTIHNEDTDRIAIKFTFDHTNDARCMLVPRDATAPTIAEVMSGHGAVTFNSVDSVVNTFTPAGTALQTWTTKTSGTEQTIWFGKADGTEPDTKLGTLEDSYTYDAYCAQADTELLSAKKQVETVAETVTGALTISNIVWNGADSTITISDPGAARCTVEYDDSTSPSIPQVLQGKNKDNGNALFSNSKTVLIGGDAWASTWTGLIDCVTYDIFCAHDDEVNAAFDGIFTEVDFKTTCKTITSDVALATGYTMEGDLIQVRTPLTAWDRMSIAVVYSHSDPIECIILPKDATEPSLTQIFAGTDGDDTAALEAPAGTTGTTFSVMFTGLSSDTEYDVWCAQGDEPTAEQERTSLKTHLLFKTVKKKIISGGANGATIRDDVANGGPARYVASTGFTLGIPVPANIYYEAGFMWSATPLQLNAERFDGIEATSNANPPPGSVEYYNGDRSYDGVDLAANWIDPEFYSLKIDTSSGAMNVYTYGADICGSVVANFCGATFTPYTMNACSTSADCSGFISESGVQWTLTAWGHTIMRGTVEESGGTTKLIVKNGELRAGTLQNVVQAEVIAYTFNGAASSITTGSTFGVELKDTVGGELVPGLQLASGYTMDGIQITAPLPAWDTVSVRIKYSHTDPVQCVLRDDDVVPTEDEIFDKTGASVTTEFNSYVTPDQGTGTAATWFVQEFTGLDEGHKYTAHCAQAKLDDRKNLVAQHSFATVAKKITAALALAPENSDLGCAVGTDPDCPGEDKQIKLPLSSWETVAVTITYSHDGTIRCAALTKDRLTPTNKELQDGLTLEDYESSPAAVNNTGGTQVKVTFTGLLDGTYYDFICVQDRYDTAGTYQVLRNSKISYRTVPKVFQEQPSIEEQGHYGIKLALKTSHDGTGACVVVPAANIATHATCIAGEGVVFITNQTFLSETEWTHTWDHGLEENTDYKLYCCQGGRLISVGLAFTTPESQIITQDTHVTEILDTTASVSVGFTDYNDLTCVVEAMGSLPDKAAIQALTPGTLRASHEITKRVATDAFWIQDNHDLMTWYMDGFANPDITTTQYKTYTFVRVTPGHTMRIVAEADCTDCDTGTYTAIPATGVTDDIINGSPQQWTPDTTGTYYYVSTVQPRMVGKITVAVGVAPEVVAASAPPTEYCEYEPLTDMPWNQTLPGKMSNCVQPNKIKWLAPTGITYDVINPYRDIIPVQGGLYDVGYPGKIAYNNYNQNNTLINAEKSFEFTGLTRNTRYQAICGATGDNGEWVTSSLVAFRTLQLAGDVTLSLLDSRDDATMGQALAYLPQPLGEVSMSSPNALYIVFTTNGSDPICDQTYNIMPGGSGLSSRVTNLKTLKARGCGELAGLNVVEQAFEMSCYTDYRNLPAPFTFDVNIWPAYTNVPAWEPRLPNGYPFKCTFVNPYTGLLQSPCEDGGNYLPVEFKNTTCTATIEGVSVLNDANCDDGGEGSDYSDCSVGTDYDAGQGGCPARMVDGFCDNSCKIRCTECPRVPVPLPFCGHHPNGTQLKWECPDLDENRNPATGLCNDECPPVCAICPFAAVLTDDLVTCGISGWDNNLLYASLSNIPCPEGDPQNPDTPNYDVDFERTQCDNTCTFANDGVCDEPEGENNCDDGTDCADCGPSQIKDMFCPSGCLPQCDACPRNLPAPVCGIRDKACPADRTIVYDFAVIDNPPACPDLCFPECFECPAYIEEANYVRCDDPAAADTGPCGLFGGGNTTCLDGDEEIEFTECSERRRCEIGCPTRCYTCTPKKIASLAGAAPLCRQLPKERLETGCVKQNVEVENYTDYVVCNNGEADATTCGFDDTTSTFLVDHFNELKCSDGCALSCKPCPPLDDPYPSCEEDKLGDGFIRKCTDGSPTTSWQCHEGGPPPCLYDADTVCGSGCPYTCKACSPPPDPYHKCDDTEYTAPCVGGENPRLWDFDNQAWTGDNVIDQTKDIYIGQVPAEEFYMVTIQNQPDFRYLCDDGCYPKCFNCPPQPDPLPRCGRTNLPCPEAPPDKPILANSSDPLSTNCTESKCPILCEQCPDAPDPLPLCLEGQNPCEGEFPLATCEDGSPGYDNLCDTQDEITFEITKPICHDLCVAQCDHCEVIPASLPKCGQYPDGIHVREPCKDNSTTNTDGRCTDKCLPGCVKCDDLPDPYPMCGKQPNNQDILPLCLDGTVNAGLNNEGLCADGCATRCELCGEILTPLPKCGQHIENATHKRVRCEDGSDDTMTANGDCDDTCQPTCDFCTDVALPIPKCGRNPDGTQLNFECADNEPVSILTGLCADGCYPLCEPCDAIVNAYDTCEPTQQPCQDGSEPMCTTFFGDGQAEPVSWQSSLEEGVTVCPEAATPHPRCDDLCTPVCITATCDACDSSKSFLKVEDEDSHTDGFPTRLIIQTNGLPIHPMEPYPEGGWPQDQKISDILDINGYTASDFAAAPTGSCPFCTTFKLPKHAEKGTQFWQLQSDIDVGISTFTGAYLYNHYHASDDVAVSQYGQNLDFCSGYATNDCVYHYHAYPECVQSYVGNCGLIGYLYDGLPVLSTCRINGVDLSSCYVLNQGESGTKTSHYSFQESSNCHLDRANGFEFSEADISWLTQRGVALSTLRNFNGYAYIMTKNYPWMMPGFYGTQWGGFGCPKAYTNEWTPQNECVEVSPLCVPLVERTPQQCDCSVDDSWCVETNYDSAVAYYNRRPPVISLVSFTSVSTIINSDSTVQVSIQVSKPIVKADSPLVLNWVGEDQANQQYEFYYTGESTMADGVTKQYIWEIPLADLPNKPIDKIKTLMVNSASGVRDELNQRTGFTTDKTFQFENSCTPDYNAVGYNIDQCLGAGGQSIQFSECIVDCYPGGYSFANQSVTKICRSNDIPFEYVGCSGRCVAPTVAPAYDTSNCDTTTGPLGVAACNISCATGFVESSNGIDISCPGDGQVFQFSGCNAECKVGSSDINDAAYDLTNCAWSGNDNDLVGDCSVSCAPNYQGNPVIACEEGGQPWTIITGSCEAECIAPTDVSYNLQKEATQSNAILTCSSGYELSRTSNSIFPTYTCPGPGLAFTASGCGIACSTNFHYSVDGSGCVGDPLVREDECILKCSDGHAACIGTTCSDPQPVCATPGGVMGQTMTCVPACTLPNDPDFLQKYNLVDCPGPVYTTESCQLSCAGGFSSQGQVGTSCTFPNGEIQITNGCSSACSIDFAPPEYDYTNCVVPAGGSITEYECQPTCAAGYIAGPAGAKASCSLSTLKFTFSGCSSSNCKNTPSIVCDDGIGCTSDVCDPNSIIYDSQYASSTQSGCYHIPTNELCEDSYGCTDNTCSPADAGADVNGCIIAFTDSKCDDGVACTADVCSPYEASATSAGCVFTTDDSQCNDDSVCTVDVCVIGQGCTNEPIECNDGVFCTVDACDPIDGCVFTADNTLCTDSWPCTMDICDATLDCQHVADDKTCEDAYACTIDKCSLDSNAGLDGCSHELDNTVCNDGASCSTNICAPLSSEDATGCYNTYDNTPCNDGVACTRDFCSPSNENATTATGCVNQNICGIINPACTLDLEVNEEGIVIKPYVPCVEGKTFSSCETVQVTLSLRKEEIKKREKTAIEEYLESIKDNPPGVCNPSPCLGLNSTCEVLKNDTTNVTKFKCHCPKGQKGDRCEFLAVSEDTKAPAAAAFFIVTLGGVVIGGFVVFNLITQILTNSKDAAIAVAEGKLRQPLMPTQIRRRTKRSTLNFS